MTQAERDSFRRRMGEAASLPPNHPERQAVAEEVAAAGAELEQEWIDLVCDDERLRIELMRVAPPPGLEQRLLIIPGQVRRRWWWSYPWTVSLAVAAVVLTVVAFIAVPELVEQSRQSSAAGHFATLAAVAHQSRPELELVTSEWQAVQAALADRISFMVTRPHHAPPGRLVGASTLRLGGNTVLYSRWQDADRTYSLYQFCGPDFGIQSPLSRRVIEPTVAGNASALNVTLWTEGHCDYALVTAERSERSEDPPVPSPTSVPPTSVPPPSVPPTSDPI